MTLLGTVMMSGCGILTNGKGTRREYGEFNLDELVVSKINTKVIPNLLCHNLFAKNKNVISDTPAWIC